MFEHYRSAPTAGPQDHRVQAHHQYQSVHDLLATLRHCWQHTAERWRGAPP
jgi:hypothetical protein